MGVSRRSAMPPPSPATAVAWTTAGTARAAVATATVSPAFWWICWYAAQSLATNQSSPSAATARPARRAARSPAPAGGAATDPETASGPEAVSVSEAASATDGGETVVAPSSRRAAGGLRADAVSGTPASVPGAPASGSVMLTPIARPAHPGRRTPATRTNVRRPGPAHAAPRGVSPATPQPAALTPGRVAVRGWGGRRQPVKLVNAAEEPSMDALVTVPTPRNEPVREYAPGHPQTESLRRRLAELASAPIE